MLCITRRLLRIRPTRLLALPTTRQLPLHRSPSLARRSLTRTLTDAIMTQSLFLQCRTIIDSSLPLRRRPITTFSSSSSSSINNNNRRRRRLSITTISSSTHCRRRHLLPTRSILLRRRTLTLPTSPILLATLA
jgi:hypothetical protein